MKFVEKKNIGFLITSFAIIALYVYGIIEIAPASFSNEAMGISLLVINMISSLVVYIRWEYFSICPLHGYIIEDFCVLVAWFFIGLWLREDSKMKKDNYKEMI